MQAESSLGSRDREGRTGHSDSRCFQDQNGDQRAVVRYLMFYFFCALTTYCTLLWIGEIERRFVSHTVRKVIHKCSAGQDTGSLGGTVFVAEYQWEKIYKNQSYQYKLQLIY